ncbi:MAG: CHAD domain-containing protein [Planctomycetes bacterium]|nr:CHAD domain-containing protein [Planctomycetota bacterium]
MADEKWIEGLQSSMPVTEAAGIVLALRLEAVRERLSAAVFHADDDIEHVHRLRVSTRRAAAGLRLFADCMPARLAKKTRQALRSLRRAAGEARDWDVFLQLLRPRGNAPLPQRPGIDFLLGYAHGQRVLAQEHLQTAFADHADDFERCLTRINKHTESCKAARSPLNELAGVVLTDLVRQFEAAAEADLAAYEALHRVRILGKQLRYAMEVFESCYGKAFRRDYYPAIVEMQDILGDANDSYTISQRLTALRTRLMKTQPRQWPQYRAGIEAVLHFHEKRLPLQRKKFEKWWRAWQKSGAERAFAELVRMG